MRTHVGLFILLPLLGSVAAAFADPVYKGEDETGRTVYSSKPGVPGESPHSLPRLTKSNSKTPSAPSDQTCRRHGGIACGKGPDGDGSVICYDGYSEAAHRFAVSCTAAKLSIVKIEQPGPNGRLVVALRNTKGVPADSPEVTYMLDRSNRVTLTGPTQIPAYGTGDFTAPLPKAVLPLDGSPVSSKHLWITCGNCG